ncbi:MAG: D-amino-acid oxidase [Verrucomicrobiota bacterium]
MVGRRNGDSETPGVAKTIAVIGAGVSGLTSAILLAEHGDRTAIFAEEIGPHTTSAAAGAIWFPYDAGPCASTIEWSLATYRVLQDLARDPRTGVLMIEQRVFSRRNEIEIPDWALPLGARRLHARADIPALFTSGFAIDVPLMDTTIYLNYLAHRFAAAGGEMNVKVRFEKLEDVETQFDFIINCAGIGARTLVHDPDLEPHRGQVAIVPKMGIECAIVCDDAPLMYSIPRTNDCVFGGTNDLSDDRAVEPAATARIVAECSRVLDIRPPEVLAERVGIRPFRSSGVRVERAQLRDGRAVIHNYGHGGAGFTLSWGCAREVLRLAA